MALLFCSCSQTTIHLYSRYLSVPQIEAINKELVAADFIVKPNQLKFPRSIIQSSLTYSPLIDDPDAVNKVINSMSRIGWHIQQTNMLFTDNYWYKGHSIALLLLPSGVDPQAVTNQQDWANQYTSQDCKLSLTIHLESSGQYQILTDHNQLLKHDYAQGKWTMSHFPYLELRAEDADWGFYLELKHYLKTDKIGDIQISELSPMSNYIMFADCTFVYGVRV